MNEKKWVQHMSGQGKKWEVAEWDQFCWRTEEGTGVHSNCNKYFLPKSEYRLCDPPEEWEDVTEECKWVLNKVGWSDSPDKASIGHNNTRIEAFPDQYRLRKVQLFKYKVQLFKDGASYNHNTEQWAFIVERRKK